MAGMKMLSRSLKGMPATDRRKWKRFGKVVGNASAKTGVQTRRKTVLFPVFFLADGKTAVWKAERRCFIQDVICTQWKCTETLSR